MKWVLKVEDGRMRSTSEYQRASLNEWLRKNEGKHIVLTPHDKVSQNKRGYFEGAIVPSYCEWHEALDPYNKDHCDMVREMLKTEFNGVLIKGVFNKPQKVGKSTAKLNNDEFGKFIERIVAYFDENQIPIPDPELYKRWNDMFSFDSSNYWEWLRENNLQADGTKKEHQQGNRIL